jgi:hypothetical protein
MRLLLIFSFFIQIVTGYSQSDLRKVKVADLPQIIQNIENVSSAFRWTDSVGDNVVVSKRTTPAIAYHFQIIKDSAILTWKTVGISQHCTDERVTHVKSWFVLTDLNHNAKAEVWLVYKGECVGDDDMGKMKIIMIENYRQYVMQGSIAGDDTVETFFDNNFRNGAAIFRNYALQLWRDSLKK